jgi:hypothetical protein
MCPLFHLAWYLGAQQFALPLSTLLLCVHSCSLPQNWGCDCAAAACVATSCIGLLDMTGAWLLVRAPCW